MRTRGAMSGKTAGMGGRSPLGSRFSRNTELCFRARPKYLEKSAESKLPL
jgi:hypothetical protein